MKWKSLVPLWQSPLNYIHFKYLIFLKITMKWKLPHLYLIFKKKLIPIKIRWKYCEMWNWNETRITTPSMKTERRSKVKVSLAYTVISFFFHLTKPVLLLRSLAGSRHDQTVDCIISQQENMSLALSQFFEILSCYTLLQLAWIGPLTHGYMFGKFSYSHSAWLDALLILYVVNW